MTHRPTSHDGIHYTGWHILGELEMPAGSAWVKEIRGWLMETLEPLDLAADFMDKILLSAQEAVASAVQPDIHVRLDHIHCVVYAQKEHGSQGETWGFFRIVNIFRDIPGMSSLGQNIEFYLYLEG